MISKAELTISSQENLDSPRPLVLRHLIDDKARFYLFKRIFDIVFSIIVSVLILSWLFPVIAILIKLESRGPVFFVQKRVGRGGRSFRCLKFRTMIVNLEANSTQALQNDRRITKMGRFLRVSNLDEFPQFLNVIAGDMSIVGPRPHMHSDCSRFSSVVASYKFRNMVKPGITGLAQVKGYRGPAKDFISIFHRYQFDAFYVRNANFWLDMRIIRKTAAQTFHAIVDKTMGQDPIASGSASAFFKRKWVVAIRSFLS